MTRPKAKGEENEDLAYLMKLWSELEGAVVVEERESPDFILRLADGSPIGLEHTRLAREDVRAWHADVRRLEGKLREAVDEVQTETGVYLHMGPARLRRRPGPEVLRSREQQRSAVEAFKQLLVEFVRRGTGSSHNDRAGLDAAGALWLDELVIERAPSPMSMLSLTVTVSGDQGAGVLARVAAKEHELSNYRAERPDVTRYWLLLVGGWNFADPNRFEVATVELGETPFERVLYLDRRMRFVHPLRGP